jgi:hypothetical protein
MTGTTANTPTSDVLAFRFSFPEVAWALPTRTVKADGEVTTFEEIYSCAFLPQQVLEERDRAELVVIPGVDSEAQSYRQPA